MTTLTEKELIGTIDKLQVSKNKQRMPNPIFKLDQRICDNQKKIRQILNILTPKILFNQVAINQIIR